MQIAEFGTRTLIYLITPPRWRENVLIRSGLALSRS